MNKIDEIYFKIFDAPTLPDLLIGLVSAVLVFAAFKIVAKVISGKANFIAQKIFKIKSEEIEQAVVATITKPINNFITITGIVAAVMLVPFSAVTGAAVDAFAKWTDFYNVYKFAL